MTDREQREALVLTGLIRKLVQQQPPDFVLHVKQVCDEIDMLTNGVDVVMGTPK